MHLVYHLLMLYILCVLLRIAFCQDFLFQCVIIYYIGELLMSPKYEVVFTLIICPIAWSIDLLTAWHVVTSEHSLSVKSMYFEKTFDWKWHVLNGSQYQSVKLRRFCFILYLELVIWVLNWSSLLNSSACFDLPISY